MMKKLLMCLWLLTSSYSVYGSDWLPETHKVRCSQLFDRLTALGDEKFSPQVRSFMELEKPESKAVINAWKKSYLKGQINPFMPMSIEDYDVERVDAHHGLSCLFEDIKKHYAYAGQKSSIALYSFIDEIEDRLTVVSSEYKYPLAQDEQIRSLLYTLISKGKEKTFLWGELERYLEVDELIGETSSLFQDCKKSAGYQPVHTSSLHAFFRQIDMEDYQAEAKEKEEKHGQFLIAESLGKRLMEDEEGSVALTHLTKSLYEMNIDFFASELERILECKIYEGLPDILSHIEFNLKDSMRWGSPSGLAVPPNALSSMEKLKLLKKKFSH